MKRRLVVPVLAALVMLVLTSAVASANVTGLTVHANPISIGRIAIVTGTVTCGSGHPVEIDVSVTRGGVTGTGETFLTCTGSDQHWRVYVDRGSGKWGVGRATENVSVHGVKENSTLMTTVPIFLLP